MQPTLHSSRLILRPYTLDDAADVQRLAGDIRIADTTLTIPHPYPDRAAENWISGHARSYENGSEIAYAITLISTGELIGTVSLIDVQHKHARAELGYWIGVPYWANGYCTEAVGRLIKFAIEQMGMTRIVARCLARNPASARVMEKAGLVLEGCQRTHVFKNGVYEDILLYGLVLPSRGEIQATIRTSFP